MPRLGVVSTDGGGLRRTALALLLAAGSAGAVRAGQIELVSKADPLPGSTGVGLASALSADGRWVVFESTAPNLIPGQVDANGNLDLFLRDRVTGTTTLISHQAGKPATASPTVGEWSSPVAAISADGRYVAYVSPGTRLVPGQTDSNHAADVFLYDRVTGDNTLISHALGDPTTTADGISGGVAISADGSSVVFWSTAASLVAGQTSTTTDPGLRAGHVFLYDRSTGAITLLSHAAGSPAATANNSSAGAVISADGGYVAFWSLATNLLPGVTATLTNVFLWERATGRLSLVSHASGAATTPGSSYSSDPQISADGRWIVFRSQAQNLVAGQTARPGAGPDNVYLFDRISGQARLVSHVSGSPLIAAGAVDIYYGGGGFSMSADGRWVAFSSPAPDLAAGQVNLATGYNVFLYDRTTGRNTLVSHKWDSQTTSPLYPLSRQPRMSADGNFVAFESAAEDLVAHQRDTPEGWDVFLYDRAARTSVLASHVRSSLTQAANSSSGLGQISADGGTVVFDSTATDLGAGQVDLQGFQDLFAFDRRSAEVTPLTEQDPGVPATTPLGPSSAAGISADGRFVLFSSKATGLVLGQVDKPWSRDAVESGNGTWDVFLRDRATGKTTLLSRSKASPPTAAGGDSAVISADGSSAAFRLRGPDQFTSSLLLYDRAADTLHLVNHSLSPVNEPSGGLQDFPALSADGRFVAYACDNCRLVPGQRSETFNTDVFLYDRTTSANTLISHASGDPLTAGDRESRDPWISADGNVVAFISLARNLVPGQSSADGGTHAFVLDRATGAVTLIDHAAGSPATATGRSTALAGMSADGRWIIFSSDATDLVPGQVDTNQTVDMFLYDRLSGAISLISHVSSSPLTTGNDLSAPFLERHTAMISADGRWTVFYSVASDLVAGVSDINGFGDVFLYDRLSGAVSLVSFAAGSPGSTTSQGAQSAMISADGSRIGFGSASPELLPGQTGTVFRFYVQDRATGARTLLGAMTGAAFSFDPNVSFDLWMSADGRRTAFTINAPLVAGDFNDNWDAYLYDAASGPVAVPPCVLLDSVLRSNVRKTVTVAGACGVPAGARQAMVKLAVAQGTGKGNVQVYPGNVTSPSAGILRFNPGVTRSAGFTVPLGNGAVAVLPFVAGNGTVRVTLEVDGYVP